MVSLKFGVAKTANCSNRIVSVRLIAKKGSLGLPVFTYS